MTSTFWRTTNSSRQQNWENRTNGAGPRPKDPQTYSLHRNKPLISCFLRQTNKQSKVRTRMMREAKKKKKNNTWNTTKPESSTRMSRLMTASLKLSESSLTNRAKLQESSMKSTFIWSSLSLISKASGVGSRRSISWHFPESRLSKCRSWSRIMRRSFAIQMVARSKILASAALLSPSSASGAKAPRLSRYRAPNWK